MSAGEPSITLTSLDDRGVLLLPFSHPDFVAALKPGRAMEFSKVLPYTVVIKNGSVLEIIAYVVLWNCTGPDGRVVSQTRSVFNFSNLAPGASLPPNASELVSILPIIEAGHHWDGGTEATVNRLLDFYLQQKAIQISLDAVLFDDGSTAGPNDSHWIEKWRAWLEAERNVFTEATMASPVAMKDVLRKIAEPALNIHRMRSGADPENPGALAVMADRSANYSECLALAKGYFASSMLKEINEKGGDTVRNNVLNVLRSKQYPKVLGKEQVQ